MNASGKGRPVGGGTRRNPPGSRCGEYAGYLSHKRYGEEVCPACQRARREYARGNDAKRNRSPEARARELTMEMCRRRAHRKLAQEYPERFAEIFQAEVVWQEVEDIIAVMGMTSEEGEGGA